MGSLLSLIVDFLASVGDVAKRKQQERAAEELPQIAAKLDDIAVDLAAIKAEIAKAAPAGPAGSAEVK